MILVSVLTVALAAGICTDMFSGRHVLIKAEVDQIIDRSKRLKE